MDFMKKSVKLTKKQHEAATFIADVATDVLRQGSPSDDTPLEINVSEVFEVFGGKLLGFKLGN
jgi:hypothetical protein